MKSLVTRGLSIGSLVAFAALPLVGCGDDPLTASGEPCDVLCGNAGYGSADEFSTATDQANVYEFSCFCGGGGDPLTRSACADYCEDVGGDSSTARIDDDGACVCGGVAL